ncbi:chemotaxis protein CheX [Paenibacillus sp. DMB20]|uniref:chemotaxis protein CheX n=1 Tax=Paenibacillus sp. DMB20 TaxID=1642570 RepID=UPI002E1195B3
MLVDSAIESMGEVFMKSIEVSQPISIEQGLLQSEIGVLIGIMGDVQGRLIFEGEKHTFSRLGESMFGMPLSGDMLHSFVGEMANMIAGHTSTLLSGKGKHVDITPPTVMVGQMEIYGFKSGVSVSAALDQVGTIRIALLQN